MKTIKTISKIIATVAVVASLGACSMFAPKTQTADQKQNYQVQVLRNNGGNIERHGNQLTVFLPSKILFGPKMAAIQRENGIKLLQYSTKVLSTFHMKQMTIVVYYHVDQQLAKARGKVVQDYLWDANVNARFSYVKLHAIDPRSNEMERVELQIALAK